MQGIVKNIDHMIQKLPIVYLDLKSPGSNRTNCPGKKFLCSLSGLL